MYSNLLTIILTGILVTIVGCKRSDEKSSQVKNEAWWLEKSRIVSESAKRNDGVVITSTRPAFVGVGWRRWNVAIPVESKRSVEDLNYSLIKLADDFANPLIKADAFLSDQSSEQAGDSRLGVNASGFVVGGGPACVRQVISQGSGGMIWIKAELMAREGFNYHTVMDGNYDKLNKTAPEATKALFIDIMVTRWN